MVSINGWTVSNAKALEIQEAIAALQNVDITDVTMGYVRKWMGNQVNQIVKDYRRRQARIANPIDSSDTLD